MGSGLSSPVSPTYPNSLQNSAQHQRQSSLQKPLPTPLPEVEHSDTQHSSSRKVASGPGTNLIPAAEDVVRRAKGNSYDTEVIEKLAPGEYDYFFSILVTCKVEQKSSACIAM